MQEPTACGNLSHAEDAPGVLDDPWPTLGDKHPWLTQRKDQLNWRTVIAPTMDRLFAAGALIAAVAMTQSASACLDGREERSLPAHCRLKRLAHSFL